MYHVLRKIAPASIAVLFIAQTAIGQQPTNCPYRFGNDMPAGTFCVYRGSTRAQDGRLCNAEAVAIWTSTESGDSNKPEVYFATVSEPGLVLRANVAQPRVSGQRAEIVAYTTGEEAPGGTARGEITLNDTAGPRRNGDHLRVQLAAVHPSNSSDCAMATFEGEFMGVMAAPVATAHLD